MSTTILEHLDYHIIRHKKPPSPEQSLRRVALHFETATSSCKRADKYGLHKNQSLYNAYKIGKLGAKPVLGSPFILNE